jgi:antitoxin component YwqK of YwqJK toxin-antitoxin module
MLSNVVYTMSEVKDVREVYKSCQGWLVTLSFLEDTITNLDRDGVVDPMYAKFRGNKFWVTKIEDKLDPTITTDSVVNSYYNRSSLTYQVNTIVEVPDYNYNSNVICTTGIHFFLSKEPAYHYEPIVDAEGRIHGPYISWTSNGVKYNEMFYEHGMKEGAYVTYFETNGNKRCEATYKHNKEHGRYAEYRQNGALSLECNYENGELQGHYVRYGISGLPWIITEYKEGRRHGPYTSYYESGALCVKTQYDHGKLDGAYEEHYESGAKLVVTNYSHDLPHGTYITYRENGDKLSELLYCDGLEKF